MEQLFLSSIFCGVDDEDRILSKSKISEIAEELSDQISKQIDRQFEAVCK